jgi:protein TonB
MKTQKLAFVVILLFVAIPVFGHKKLTPKQIMKKNYQPVVPYVHGDQKPALDQFPSYPGGIQGLYKDIYNKMIYPMNARKEGVQGKVVVKFVVEENGTVGEVRVTKHVGKLLDDEAIRLVKHLRPWVPGYKNGKPVKVGYNLPIDFKINRKFPQQY